MVSRNFPGHYIREWRQMSQMSQAEFAKAVGMSQSNLTQIENGKTGYTQATLERIAAYLKISPAALISVNPGVDEQDVPEGEEGPRFLDQVTEILTAMQPVTRSLALDLLKAALRHEGLVENVNKPHRLNLLKVKINQDFKI